MRSKIKVFGVILFMLFINCNVNAQEKTEEIKYPETVMIKIVEIQCVNSIIPIPIEPKILIIDPDGNHEEKNLERAHLKNEDNNNFQTNALKIKLEIQKWHNKGFLVKSSSTNTIYDCCMITTFILQKN